MAIESNNIPFSPIETVDSLLDTTGAVLEIVHTFSAFPQNIWERLLCSLLFAFQFVWRLVFSWMRNISAYTKQKHSELRRLIGRIQTALRGSRDDIGWLHRLPHGTPEDDVTERFIQLLGLVRNGVHSLPDGVIYLLVPGLLSNYAPLYFFDTRKYLSKLGLTCHIAEIHSEGAVETNALELKNYIEELYLGSQKQVLLLGHSKGGVDAAAAISLYWTDLKDKVAGLVLVQSPYGGSPIASDILREGQIADAETRRAMEFIICKVFKGDVRALEDLTYDRRREFLSTHFLPSEFPIVSFHTEANIGLSVLSTMSRVAHVELPWFTISNMASQESILAPKIPVVVPAAAAMAACALYLRVRYGVKSDGLVVREDAEVPGSFCVRPDRKLDHAWMVYSPAWKDAKEPASFEICEALLTLLQEVCKKRYMSSVTKE